MKDTVSRQPAHCQRVNLPMSKVVPLMLAQHCANDLGYFSNFHTEVQSDQSVILWQLFKVAEDAHVKIDLEYLVSLTPEEGAAVEEMPKRIVFTIAESADMHPIDPGFVRDIQLYGNCGLDTDQVEAAFKTLMVRLCGLSETTIESMLPRDYSSVRISRDIVSGGLKWEYEAERDSSDAPQGTDPVDTGSHSQQDAPVDVDGPSVDSKGEVEDTDPVEDTDQSVPVESVINELESLDLNEMD